MRDLGRAAGLRVDGGPELVEGLWKALVSAGAVPAGLVARDSLRIDAGAALSGVDVSEESVRIRYGIGGVE